MALFSNEIQKIYDEVKHPWMDTSFARITLDLFTNTKKENEKILTKINGKSFIPIYRSNGYSANGKYTANKNRIVALDTQTEKGVEGVIWQVALEKMKTADNIINSLYSKRFGGNVDPDDDFAGLIDAEKKTEYIKNGGALKDLKTFMKKFNKFLANNPEDDMKTLGTMFKEMGNQEHPAWKFFTADEHMIMMQMGDDSFNENDSIDINFTIGRLDPKSLPKNIQSRMRESDMPTNCMFECIKARIPEIAKKEKCPEEWITNNGVTYQDVREKLAYYAATYKYDIIIRFRDRNGNDMILDDGKDTIRVKGRRLGGIELRKREIIIYQHDNHASLDKPIVKVGEGLFYYETQDDLNASFDDFNGICNVSIDTATSNIITWSDEEGKHLLDDEKIDREKYPDNATYLSCFYQDFYKENNGIGKEHPFKKYFGSSATDAKYTKMARPILYGNYNIKKINEIPAGAEKIDLNRAYTTYTECKYYDGLPDAPWHEIYECDNSILDIPQIEGTLFVRNIKPHFSIASRIDSNFDDDADAGINVDLTNDYLHLNDGIMSFAEARYWNAKGSIEIYAIIPSFKNREDPVMKILNSIPEKFKTLRNAFIGKLIASNKTSVYASKDEHEIHYLIGKAVEQYNSFNADKENPIGPEAEIVKRGDKHILKIINPEFSHAKYAHIHNTIIGCTRVRMFEKMEEIIKVGGTIFSAWCDSITFKVPTDYKGKMAGHDWKYEKIKSCSISPPSIRPSFQCSETLDKKFNPIVCASRYISFEAPGGFGKTMLIKSLFPNAIKIAPTHQAAKEMGEGAGTIHAFITRLNTFQDIPLFSHIWLDEASMVDKSLFESLEKALKLRYLPNKPFGGFSLIVSGDPAQLEPVYTDNGTQTRAGQNIYQIANIIKRFDRSYKFTINRRCDEELAIFSEKIRDCILTNNKTEFVNLVKTLPTVKTYPYELDYKYIVYKQETRKKINDEIIKKFGESGDYDVMISKSDYGHKNGDIVKKKDANPRAIEAGIWGYTWANTSHSTQGKTFRDTKIVVLLDEINVRDMRAFYVAITRATEMRNLIFHLVSRKRPKTIKPSE